MLTVCRWAQSERHLKLMVRVASSWAGNQLGGMHLPRIGQEVIVSFYGDDPDQPTVTARVAQTD